jgi:hypothetical protein
MVRQILAGLVFTLFLLAAAGRAGGAAAQEAAAQEAAAEEAVAVIRQDCGG